MYNHAVRAQALVVLVWLAACAPQPATATPQPKDLRPYLTTTASATVPASLGVLGAAETALPSPTPFQYTVSAGDTLSQIAEKFNVSLDAVLAANPGVDPNAMSVGSVIKIPGGQQNISGESTPTPVPLPVDQVACHATSDRGAWCFVLMRNDTTDTVENVTARITLLDAAGKSIAGQTALLPLDILAPGQSLPLSAYFPPEVPLDVSPQVQILTGDRLLPGDQRYLPASIGSTLVTVDWSGLNAQVHGVIALPGDSKPAGEIWVAAVAYDEAGGVISVRRWESNAGLAPGASLPFSFSISALAGKIERVDFAVEARPQ